MNLLKRGDENFSKYVKEKMELTFIPYISIYTAYSYEKEISIIFIMMKYRKVNLLNGNYKLFIKTIDIC